MEDGFSLISVVIAFSMFVGVLGPAALLVQQSTLVSGDVQNQIVAANLATKQLELVRSQADYSFASLVQNYLGTSSLSVAVGSASYTVSQTLTWTPGAYSPGGCGSTANGSSTLQPVLNATTSVVWPSMPAYEKPTTETATFTPPLGQYSANTGDISVQVLSASGAGQPNIAVTVVGPVGSTTTTTTVNSDSNGCAFFPFLVPGNYTASLVSPAGYNYVDPNQNSTPSSTIGVSIGQISTYQFSYDQAGSLVIPAPSTGYTLPTDLGLTLASSGIKGLGTLITNPIPSTGSFTITNLFPFTSGYEVWTGSCYTYQQGSQFPSVTLSPVHPGQTTTAANAFYPAQIEVVYNGVEVTGAQVSVNVMDPSSTSSPPYDLSCPGTSSTNYNFPLIASTPTTPDPVEVPVGYLQFSATATIAGTVHQGVFPLSSAVPPYVDTTTGTGGSIVITLS